MIYSPGFSGLPQAVRQAVLNSITAVLTGGNMDSKYKHLTAADRTAIAEILRDTTDKLPLD